MLIRLVPDKLRLQADKEGNIPILTAIDCGNLQLCQELLLDQVEAQISAVKVCIKVTKIMKFLAVKVVD